MTEGPRPTPRGGTPSFATASPFVDTEASLADFKRLTRLSAAWEGLDPTAIAASFLETLVDMLQLDFAGLRFNDSAHTFPCVSDIFGLGHIPEAVLQAMDEALQRQQGEEVLISAVGEVDVRILQYPFGTLASLGTLIVGSQRFDFPNAGETVRIELAIAQAALACREVREVSDRQAPMDNRSERPIGEALAESEWRLNLIINTIPAMAWSTTPDGMLDFCNQGLSDFVGLPAEDIMGLGFQRIFHPDDTQPILSAWQEIMASKRGREAEARVRRADGQYRWATFRQNPLLDAQGNVLKWYGVVLDIEDRKQAEAELKAAEAALLASEQNLQLIIDSLPVLAWSARPEGSADFVNKSWTDYAGVPADDLLEWGFGRYYHPDDVDEMVAIWKRDIATGDETSLTGRIRRYDGEYRRFLFSGRKLTDANGVVRWFGVNVDIENLRQAEDALRESEAALRKSEHALSLIINTIPAMAWSAMPDGMLDFWNEHFLAYVGLPFDQVRGTGFYQIFHPDDLELMRSSWEETLVTKTPREVDGRIRGVNGEYRWFTLRQSPLLDADGKVVKWYGIVVDIEDRKRAEMELQQIQTDLAHVTRIVTIGELAVSIAHEVNQPLMAVVTNAGTCLRWLQPSQLNLDLARQAAERVVRDGHRAGDIVASIRALARKSAPRMEQVDLKRLIQEVLDLLRGELQRHSVVAKAEFSRRVSMVLGDRTQLQQVVLNLVMNAIEATSLVATERRWLTVRLDMSDDVVHFSVCDTGIGIGPDYRDRIFEAFYSTKPEGIGMGLAICRSIIEAHGGRIWVSDNVPHGTVFNLTLPVGDGVVVHD